jgi:hypothetical protein
MKPVQYIADNASTSAGGVKNNGYRCRARPRRLWWGGEYIQEYVKNIFLGFLYITECFNYVFCT